VIDAAHVSGMNPPLMLNQHTDNAFEADGFIPANAVAPF
jgi:hypothetical protein